MPKMVKEASTSGGGGDAGADRVVGRKEGGDAGPENSMMRQCFLGVSGSRFDRYVAELLYIHCKD
jgi:hypothetical protein